MNIQVNSTNDNRICHNKAEIAEIIKQGAALPQGDEVYISNSEEEYPYLSILVKGNYACVHYFENDEGNVWQSNGNFDEDVVFLTGNEEWTAPDYTIISTEAAINCMEEFCDTMKRPECIQWEALWEEG